MARTSRSDELPIIRSHYELILWLTPKVGKFPREHRFTVGQRVERLLGDILEKLIRAKFTRGAKGPRLAQPEGCCLHVSRRGNALDVCLAQPNGLGNDAANTDSGPTARPFVPECGLSHRQTDGPLALH